MQRKPRLLEPKNAFAVLLLIASLFGGYSLIDTTPPELQQTSYAASIKADWDHILYGDETGGGHLHGTGIPCKSEFPEDWSVDKIQDVIPRMAANDNANWRQEDNGYFVSEQRSEDLKIRIVLNENRSEIVTSYPLNVQRNPCNR